LLKKLAERRLLFAGKEEINMKKKFLATWFIILPFSLGSEE
jgi:hypothetical protein